MAKYKAEMANHNDHIRMLCDKGYEFLLQQSGKFAAAVFYYSVKVRNDVFSDKKFNVERYNISMSAQFISELLLQTERSDKVDLARCIPPPPSPPRPPLREEMMEKLENADGNIVETLSYFRCVYLLLRVAKVRQTFSELTISMNRTHSEFIRKLIQKAPAKLSEIRFRQIDAPAFVINTCIETNCQAVKSFVAGL
eukprot:PhF_6_TR15981/c1_g1_i4/m.25038